MAHGMQIFGADGSLQVDTGTRLSRVIGTMDVNTAVGQTLSMPWPYPGVSGFPMVAVVSKNPNFQNENSPAFAYYSNGTVYYNRADDTGPITLLFMVF